jgi:uncharacterized membrane protein YkoI
MGFERVRGYPSELMLYGMGAKNPKTRRHEMNHKNIRTLLITGIVAALSQAGIGWAEKTEAQLKALAKITEEQATAIALKKVPGSTVKEKADLEEEKGKLIWSFDLATAGSPDVTEVAVDAITGAIVEVKKETPKDQQKESQEDMKAQMTLTEGQAKMIASREYPKGKFKAAWIEKEDGKLIWGVALTVPNSGDQVEVKIDATGQVLGKETETAEQQAEEKARWAAKHGGKNWDDDDKK